MYNNRGKPDKHHGTFCLKDPNPEWRNWEIPKWTATMDRVHELFKQWCEEQRDILWNEDQGQAEKEILNMQECVQQHREVANNKQTMMEAVDQEEDEVHEEEEVEEEAAEEEDEEIEPRNPRVSIV